MRTILPVILPLFLAASAPAIAAECQSWTAAVEETEGGNVMVARICAGSGDAKADLMLQCGLPDQFIIRMFPPVVDNYPPDGNPEFAARFSFTSESGKEELELRYEAMDGAMARDLKMTDPLVGLLKSGQTLRLTDPSGRLPPQDFSLDGAKAAIETLATACKAK